MCVLDEVRARRDEIYGLARRHKADRLWVFGSCARKEETPESDVDFLVRFNGATLFDMSDLQDGLERLLERKVDLVSERSVRDDPFGNQVMKDRVAV